MVRNDPSPPKELGCLTFAVHTIFACVKSYL